MLDAVENHDNLRLRMTHAVGNRWRWPQMVALCDIKALANGVCVHVTIRLSFADYCLGVGMTIAGVVFLYGFLFADVVTAFAALAIGLILMHVRVILSPQSPDELAALVSQRFMLNPSNPQAARVDGG